MIERLLVLFLLLLALVTWLLGSNVFWYPLVAGIVVGIVVLRMENKRYRTSDKEKFYTIVDDVKYNAEDE